MAKQTKCTKHEHKTKKPRQETKANISILNAKARRHIPPPPAVLSHIAVTLFVLRHLRTMTRLMRSNLPVTGISSSPWEKKRNVTVSYSIVMRAPATCTRQGSFASPLTRSTGDFPADWQSGTNRAEPRVKQSHDTQILPSQIPAQWGQP